MTVLELLRAGRENLRKNGWVQQTWENNNKHCAIGVMRHYFLAGKCCMSEYSLATKAIAAELPPEYSSVIAYNDMPGTMKEDILVLYDRAISRIAEPAAN